MDSTTHNAIKSSEAKTNGQFTSDSNIPIIRNGGESVDVYQERAEQIRRESGEPPAVIGGFEKTEQNFHPLEVWGEVPHVNDSYKDRKDKRFEGGWNDQEQFLSLYHGNFGNYNQREAESILAIKFAFAYGKHPEIIAYEMENLPFSFPTVYSHDPWHRRSVLDFAQKAEIIYCDGVNLEAKCFIAEAVQDRGVTTVPELAQEVKWGKDQIRRTLWVLEVEGWVNRKRNDRRCKADTWSDRGITNEYVAELMSEKIRLEEQEE